MRLIVRVNTLRTPICLEKIIFYFFYSKRCLRTVSYDDMVCIFLFNRAKYRSPSNLSMVCACFFSTVYMETSISLGVLVVLIFMLCVHMYYCILKVFWYCYFVCFYFFVDEINVTFLKYHIHVLLYINLCRTDRLIYFYQ